MSNFSYTDPQQEETRVRIQPDLKHFFLLFLHNPNIPRVRVHGCKSTLSCNFSPALHTTAETMGTMRHLHTCGLWGTKKGGFSFRSPHMHLVGHEFLQNWESYFLTALDYVLLNIGKKRTIYVIR